MQIRIAFKEQQPPLNLIIDQGARKPGHPFGTQFFSSWKSAFTGKYDSSTAEPLLQIADFIAFCINRITYIGLKGNLKEVDYQFLRMVEEMNINCDNLRKLKNRGFTIAELDAAMAEDRKEKGLE